MSRKEVLIEDASRNRESLDSPSRSASSSKSDESSASVASSNGWTSVPPPGTAPGAAPAVGQTYT